MGKDSNSTSTQGMWTSSSYKQGNSCYHPVNPKIENKNKGHHDYKSTIKDTAAFKKQYQLT
jgi:hypothetical protein